MRAAAGVAVGLFVAISTLAAQDVPVFRTGADVVSVDVSVTRGGRPVTGLAAADFEILDNGVAQQVRDVSYQKLPIDVTVCLDVSESVSGPVLDRLRRAVQQLERELSPADRMRLVTFNLRISRLVDFGTSTSATDAAFTRIEPFGGTAVLDAIAVALSSETSPERRHLVVVFSDGKDSHSILDSAALLDVGRRTTPTLGVVLASSGVESANDKARQQLFRDLANETGGRIDVIESGANLSGAFEKMVNDFRTSYVLRFAPAGSPARGFHDLEVTVKRPGVEVRSRTGYTVR